MKVKITGKKGKRLVFVLEDVTPAFANSLRRIMTAEVPVMAIDWVEMRENNSALFDEVIAHRLGLIPLVFDPGKFNLHEECECEGKGCTLCQAVFVLEKNGPCMVYSGDMKSSNREVRPADKNFPVVELLKGHNIKLEAVARLGLGVKHAKFQAASVSYQYYPQLKLSPGAARKDVEKGVKACPKGALSMKGAKPSLDPELCNFSKSCESASNGAIQVDGDQTKFVFRVESVSGLEPEYIVQKSAETLKSKAEDFRKQLRDL